MGSERPPWKVVFAFAGIVGAMGLSILLSHLFRTEKRLIQSIGEISETYRWGRKTWVVVDSDRDGRANARACLEPEFGNAPSEIWEDRDGDGVFEIYLKYSGGKAVYLERDLDGDGVRESRMSGDVAERFYSENPAPRPLE